MLIRPGKAVDQQCASSCLVWIVVAVNSDVVMFKQAREEEANISKRNKGMEEEAEHKQKKREGRRSRTLAKETGGEEEEEFRKFTV